MCFRSFAFRAHGYYNFISFFYKRVGFSLSLIFSLDITGGKAPTVSLFSLVSSQAFLALIFRLKFYAPLSSARLHGTNYHIWIYSIYRGFGSYKIRLVLLIHISNLFRGVIAAWYDPLLSRHGLVVAFTGLRGFFYSGFVPSPGLVCLCGWGVFHHPISLDLPGPLGAFASLDGLETPFAQSRLLRHACLTRPCLSLLLGEVLFTGGVPGRPSLLGSVCLNLDRCGIATVPSGDVLTIY